MQISELSEKNITGLYRYAALLTVDSARAGELLADACRDSAGRLAELRGEKNALVLIAKKIRAAAGESPAAEGSPLASFAEPERSHIALSALEILPAAQITSVLGEKMKSSENDILAARQWAQDFSPSENLLASLCETCASAGNAGGGKTAVILSVVCGVLLILGVVVWMMLQKADSFPGRDSIEEMVAANQHLTGMEFDPVENQTAGTLGDWFYMRGFEGYSVPADFAAMKAVGARIFQCERHSVAQVALEKSDTLAYVFRAADFGLKTGADWRYLSVDEWAVALRADGDYGFALARRGTTDELRREIAKP